MDPSSLLEQLRDVHSPESIGSWPPAIGWVLLFSIIGTALITFIFLTVRWYRSNAWRRVALKEYKLLQLKYQQSPSTQRLSEISSLLKRCATSLNKDPTLLSMTGEAWKNLLEVPKSPLSEQEIRLLCFGHYQEECDQLDTAALLRIKRWIKTLNCIEVKRSYSEESSTINLPIQNEKIENKTS